MGKKSDNVDRLRKLGCVGNNITELMTDFLSHKNDDMTYTAYGAKHGISQSVMWYWCKKLGKEGGFRNCVHSVSSAKDEKDESGNSNINHRLYELGYSDGDGSVIAAIARFIYDEVTIGKASVASCARKLRVDEETVEFYIQRASEVPRFAALIRTGSEDVKKNSLRTSNPQHELIGARSTLQMISGSKC
jgi:hypothetical protein